MNILRVQKGQGTETTTEVKRDKRIFTTLKRPVEFLLVVEALVTSEKQLYRRIKLIGVLTIN